MWSQSFHSASSRSSRRRRAAEAIPKAIEERIEIVVFDDEDPLLRMRAVVVGQMPGDLQPQGRLARPLFAEHDRRGRLGRIAVDFVPRRMVHAGDAMLLEHRIGLRIFLGERIGGDAVMIEELLDFHWAGP